MSAPFEFKIIWDGIQISITYTPKRFHDDFDHIEIRAEEGQVLPITESGYRSHFLPREALEEYGGAECFVRAWLDYEAGNPTWMKHKEASRQYTLFD